MIDKLIKGLQNFIQWRHDHGHCYWVNVKVFRTTMANSFDSPRGITGQECSICSDRRSAWVPKINGKHIPTPYDDCYSKAEAWVKEEKHEKV